MARLCRPLSGTLIYEFKPMWLRSDHSGLDGNLDRLASLLRTLMDAHVERCGTDGWEMVSVVEASVRAEKVRVELLFTDGCETEALRVLAELLDRSRALEVLGSGD